MFLHSWERWGGGYVEGEREEGGEGVPLHSVIWGDTALKSDPVNILVEVDTKDNDPYCRFGYCSCVEFFYASLIQL